MAELRDDPRPDVYWPNTPSQWREPTVDDCTWYAGEFAWQRASENKLNMHPVKDLRDKSIDKEGGTEIDVMMSEMDRLWPESERVVYNYGLRSREYIIEALKYGASIIYGGDYEKLPPHYRRWTYNDTFNHAMASADFRDGKTFLYDPLGGGPQREFYDGEWIDIDALLTFNWGRGSRYWVGVVENEGELPVKYLNLPSEYQPDRVARVEYGAYVRSAPRITADVKRRFWNKMKERHLLYATEGWKCILWKEDGEWQWGYVSNSDIIATKPVEVPAIGGDCPDEPDCTEEQTRIQELEDALVDVSSIVSVALEPDVVETLEPVE